MFYSDEAVDLSCGAHAYTLRKDDDNDALALSGAAPIVGDPETISSLQTDHFGVLAGLLWMWILTKKYNIQNGRISGVVDNITVVDQITEGIDTDDNKNKHLSADHDFWVETSTLLKKMPITCCLCHVKGHQDDMHKK